MENEVKNPILIGDLMKNNISGRVYEVSNIDESPYDIYPTKYTLTQIGGLSRIFMDSNVLKFWTHYPKYRRNKP